MPNVMEDFRKWKECKDWQNNPKYQVMEELSAEEYQALKEDIRQNGVRVPIALDQDGNIIDGHNRMKIVAELKDEGIHVEFKIQMETYKTEKDKREAAYSLNLNRRHLDIDGKRRMATKLLKEFYEKSDRELGRLVGFDSKTITTMRAKLELSAEIPHQEKRVDKKGNVQQSANKNDIRKELKKNSVNIYGISASRVKENNTYKIMVKSSASAKKLGVSRHILSGIKTKEEAAKLQEAILNMNMPETIESHLKACEYLKATVSTYTDTDTENEETDNNTQKENDKAKTPENIIKYDNYAIVSGGIKDGKIELIYRENKVCQVPYALRSLFINKKYKSREDGTDLQAVIEEIKADVTAIVFSKEKEKENRVSLDTVGVKRELDYFYGLMIEAAQGNEVNVSSVMGLLKEVAIFATKCKFVNDKSDKGTAKKSYSELLNTLKELEDKM